MAEISVRFARRDAGAQPAHPKPQAARRVRLGAQISEHARGLARGRRGASMTVAKPACPSSSPATTWRIDGHTPMPKLALARASFGEPRPCGANYLLVETTGDVGSAAGRGASPGSADGSHLPA